MKPVSYTHLDVYKRQGQGKAEGKAAGKGGRAMKAEILFPEVCNLYGDLQNIYYLKPVSYTHLRAYGSRRPPQ